MSSAALDYDSLGRDAPVHVNIAVLPAALAMAERQHASGKAFLAALVLGFARALGEFGATIAFVSNIPGETRTLSLAIYSALQAPGGEGTAARLAVLSILVSLGALVASEMLMRRSARNAP